MIASAGAGSCRPVSPTGRCRSGSVQPGPVGDQLAVVADQQVADDLPERVQLGVAGLDQPGADVVFEPRLLRVASA
jgi:hypothetical protein